jgi:NADPH:quinone reductase-like Zn-dependent oxidoreductase
VAPPVGASFPLADAADALRLIEGRRAVGKVVLTV